MLKLKKAEVWFWDVLIFSVAGDIFANRENALHNNGSDRQVYCKRGKNHSSACFLNLQVIWQFWMLKICQKMLSLVAVSFILKPRWSLKYSNVSQLGLFWNSRLCNHGFLLFILGFYCWAWCGMLYNVTWHSCWEESKLSQPDPVQWETPLVFLHLAEHWRILTNLHEHINISNRTFFFY